MNTVAICTFDAVINGEMRTGCQSIVNSLSSFRRKAVATSRHARNGEYSRYPPSQTIAKRRRIFGEADRASTRFDPFENRRLGDALSVARQNTFTRDTSPADVKKPQSFYEMIFAAYDRYAPTDYENVTRLVQRYGSNFVKLELSAGADSVCLVKYLFRPSRSCKRARHSRAFTAALLWFSTTAV